MLIRLSPTIPLRARGNVCSKNMSFCLNGKSIITIFKEPLAGVLGFTECKGKYIVLFGQNVDYKTKFRTTFKYLWWSIFAKTLNGF